MRLVSCVGKLVASAKGEKPVVVSAKKIYNLCQVREKMQLLPGRERSDWCQARENTQLGSSAGKQATGAKPGKTSNRS